MRTNYILPTILLAGATLAACSMQPEKNAVLDEARNNYSTAQNDPDVTKLATIELQQAGKALDEANAAQKKREDEEVVDHLAYMAKQRVAIAQETGKLRATELTATETNAAREKIRLDMRTAEADAAKNQVAAANANAEVSKQSLAAQTAESDKQALMAKQSSDQSTAELAAANARVSEMETELKDLNAKKTDRGLVITLSDVLFDTNKANLRSSGTVNMQKLADFFQEYPERKALIEGYTDSTGSSNYNQDLSERRASSVRDTLIHMGINGERISTRGYGEENPVASNQTTSGRQLNRRVEIVLSDENGDIVQR